MTKCDKWHEDAQLIQFYESTKSYVYKQKLWIRVNHTENVYFSANVQPLRFYLSIIYVEALKQKCNFRASWLRFGLARDCELLNRLPSFSMPMQTVYFIAFQRCFLHSTFCQRWLCAKLIIVCLYKASCRSA